MSTELQKKAVKAAQAFLLHRDFDILEVLDNSDTFDIVADDGRQIVFVEVAVEIGEDYPDEVLTADKRKRFERAANKYLRDIADALPAYQPIRFDNISLAVFSDNRAALRHHQNAFGVGECVTVDEEEKLKNTVEKLRKIHQHMIPED